MTHPFGKRSLRRPLLTHHCGSKPPNLPLPPQPITTCWGTWMEAAIFYYEHFDADRESDRHAGSDQEDGAAIKKVQQLLTKNQLRTYLALIDANLSLPSYINWLPSTQGFAQTSRHSCTENIASQVARHTWQVEKLPSGMSLERHCKLAQ